MSSYAETIARVLEIERSEAERQGDEVDSVPRPPATDAAIAAAEAARDRTFPDAYTDFLRTADGWDHFAWGIGLFGTEELSGEAYEEAEEVLGYSEDAPEEITEGLIIGANENDATVIVLVASGEVVDFLYEETERYDDLDAYLRSRETTLLEMRADAERAIASTEAEWEPAARAAADAQLAATLAERLAGAEALPPPVDPAALAEPDADPTPDPTELVHGEHTRVELGLVLYLSASPTRDEVLETFRAVHRTFPFEGTTRWCLADRMVFSMQDADDIGSEPFADALRIDDGGHFGVRLLDEREDGSTQILNIRGMPPDPYADPPVRRASFVELLVPASCDPQRLRELTHALVDVLPVRSGRGGWVARHVGRDDGPGWEAIFGWCRRYFGLEPAWVDGWLEQAASLHCGAGWLTVLGPPFVEALGELVPDGVHRHDGRHGVVLTAGEPTLGDVSAGDFPVAVARVARALAPVSLSAYHRTGMISMGGVWFSTESSELPGAFSDHHATGAFLLRLVEPQAFLGPTARERGLALLERLQGTVDAAARKAWADSGVLRDTDSFRGLLQAVAGGSYHCPDPALSLEALQFCARFEDTAPAYVYNNVLLVLLSGDRLDEALALIPAALRTAASGPNPHTYHNAACVLARVGRLDEAFDCVRLASEAGYPLMDRIQADEDLVALRDREDWKALFP